MGQKRKIIKILIAISVSTLVFFASCKRPTNLISNHTLYENDSTLLSTYFEKKNMGKHFKWFCERVLKPNDISFNDLKKYWHIRVDSLEITFYYLTLNGFDNSSIYDIYFVLKKKDLEQVLPLNSYSIDDWPQTIRRQGIQILPEFKKWNFSHDEEKFGAFLSGTFISKSFNQFSFR